MTIHAYKNAAVSALALAMLACAAPAYAAGDYHIKFGGVDGDTEGKDDGKHRDWILIESVQLGAERSAGGVNVATGDINGDGATDHSAHTHKPISIRKEVDKSKPAPAANKKIAAPDDDQTAALLLPAVQKVRVAAARTPAWAGCAAGQKIEGMTIKQVSTGRTGRILDPVVATCATESVSFNFTKIEWK
jgi:type VI protein secretion system component Hcp